MWIILLLLTVGVTGSCDRISVGLCTCSEQTGPMNCNVPTGAFEIQTNLTSSAQTNGKNAYVSSTGVYVWFDAEVWVMASLDDPSWGFVQYFPTEVSTSQFPPNNGAWTSFESMGATVVYENFPICCIPEPDVSLILLGGDDDDDDLVGFPADGDDDDDDGFASAPAPTSHPTKKPANNPTLCPTKRPTNEPTYFPTGQPTFSTSFSPAPPDTCTDLGCGENCVEIDIDFDGCGDECLCISSSSTTWDPNTYFVEYTVNVGTDCQTAEPIIKEASAVVLEIPEDNVGITECTKSTRRLLVTSSIDVVAIVPLSEADAAEATVSSEDFQGDLQSAADDLGATFTITEVVVDDYVVTTTSGSTTVQGGSTTTTIRPVTTFDIVVTLEEDFPTYTNSTLFPVQEILTFGDGLTGGYFELDVTTMQFIVLCGIVLCGCCCLGSILCICFYNRKRKRAQNQPNRVPQLELAPRIRIESTNKLPQNLHTHVSTPPPDDFHISVDRYKHSSLSDVPSCDRVSKGSMETLSEWDQNLRIGRYSKDTISSRFNSVSSQFPGNTDAVDLRNTLNTFTQQQQQIVDSIICEETMKEYDTQISGGNISGQSDVEEQRFLVYVSPPEFSLGSLIPVDTPNSLDSDDLHDVRKQVWPGL